MPLSILVFEGERRKAMFFKRAQTEDLIVDSLEIADRFGSSLSDFCRHMQCGTITSFVEVGTADKEDPACLSLRFGNRLERVVLDDENKVRHEKMTFLRSSMYPDGWLSR